jgi:glycerophosphoryl diester phosphodiesterase
LVYTVNDPEELLAVTNTGVDGIFTDYYLESTRILTSSL